MRKYLDKEGNSRVDSYEYGENYFNVLLKAGEEVNYVNTSVEGDYSLNKLRYLADSGEGLDAYMVELELLAHGETE
jgi:hypothetical protein